jgi:hypothetical protein
VQLWWIKELSPGAADDDLCSGLCDEPVQAGDSGPIDLALQAIALTCGLVLGACGARVPQLPVLFVEAPQVRLAVEHAVDV